MKKFILAFTLIFTLLLISSISIVSANNDAGNAAMKATDGVRNVVGGAENAVEDVVDGDNGNNSTNGLNTMENGNNGDNSTTQNNGMSTTGDFTATRTATNNGTTDSLGTAWTWIIVAIIAIVIIAVIWYYSTRTNDE